MSAAQPPQGATALQDVLALAADALAYPLLALWADGRLLHANLAARELLQAGTAFVLGSGQQITPHQASRRQAFAAALRAAAEGKAQTIHWPDGPHAVLALLTPLAEPRHGTPAPPLMLAMAPTANAAFDSQDFAADHGLSPAETRLLDRLIQGNSPQTAATALHLQVSTVRSQITSIRRKTGHANVAALLAALGGLPPLRRTTHRP